MNMERRVFVALSVWHSQESYDISMLESFAIVRGITVREASMAFCRESGDENLDTAATMFSLAYSLGISDTTIDGMDFNQEAIVSLWLAPVVS